jgi:putative tryptophan/tyrosine transport system substrate-binding protein
MAINIARRKFIAALSGATAAWPLAARAQQPAMPVVGFVHLGSPDTSANYAAAFRKGLNETGYANPGTAEPTLRDVQEAAPTIGLQIQIILNATTIGEIDAAFATLTRERPDALFVAPDSLFTSRRVQFATLTTRDRIPATYANRDFVEAGGLMSYGGDLADLQYQVGIYTGRILNGTKPADLPVLQSTKFEFVINRQTARALGIEIPSAVLSIADEVIE